MKKLLTLIITATIVVAISGCDFRTHTTVYPKHGPSHRLIHPRPLLFMRSQPNFTVMTGLAFPTSGNVMELMTVGAVKTNTIAEVLSLSSRNITLLSPIILTIVKRLAVKSVAMTMTGISSGLTLMSMFTKCASTRHVSTTTGMTLGMLAQTAGTNNPYCPYIL